MGVCSAQFRLNALLVDFFLTKFVRGKRIHEAELQVVPHVEVIVMSGFPEIDTTEHQVHGGIPHTTTVAPGQFLFVGGLIDWVIDWLSDWLIY